MLDFIKKFFMFVLFPWYRKGNRIFIYKKNGKKVESWTIKGITVRFRGKNSTIVIEEPTRLERRLLCNRSKIKINGNNNFVKINKTNHLIANLKIINLQNNNKLTIDDNFYQTASCIIDFCNLSNQVVEIGKGCMFGLNSHIMCGDCHKIYDIETNEQINLPTDNIIIGDNVWLARDVLILKNVHIANNTIVGARSTVTNKFSENNTIIAGTPAKVVKRNVRWEN